MKQRIVIVIFFLFFRSICFGQTLTFDFEKVIADNKNIVFHVDTLFCDTIIERGLPIGGCGLHAPGYLDTAKIDSIILSTTYIYNVSPQKGLTLLVLEDGKKESFGFVGVKYKFGLNPIFKRTYIRKGFWVFYKNGIINKTVNYKGRQKHESFIEYYPDGKVYAIKISNKRKSYIEIYDKKGNKISTTDEYNRLETEIHTTPVEKE